MEIDKEVLHCVAAGWLQIKKGHVKEAYLCYAKGDEKRLHFVMQVNSWYYGGYPIFVDGHYHGKFTPEAMDIIAKHFFPGEYEELNKEK